MTGRKCLKAALWIAFFAAVPCATAQKFYPDDPLSRDPPPLPVKDAAARGIDAYYDFFLNTFFPPAPDRDAIRHHQPGPSQAVNTLGEVPDSAWFTNRIGARAMSLAELVRGPGASQAPDPGHPWDVLSGKNQGVSPGLVIRDSAGRKYFVKFDPKANPEMASAADVIASKFLYDIGYNTPQNYIVTFTREQLEVGKSSVFTDVVGHQRPMKARDVDAVLAKVPREPDGRYRAVASLSIEGKILGPFRYFGTRTDDPNDIVNHEERRDLRGLYVFFAWLNHTDAKSGNSMDALVSEGDRPHVEHFLLDFGDSMGSDSIAPKDPRRGNAYAFQFKPAIAQFLSLGLYVPDWMRADYPHIPEIGHFEYRTFDPADWHSNYPNAAFELRMPEDSYWAAKKVMAFDDRAIRAIVETGRYRDPHAVEWATRCLIERRDKIGREFFHEVLPLDHFAVRDGRLVFDDLAVKYGFDPARSYSVHWSVFDNVTGSKAPIAGASSFTVPLSNAPYLAAEIASADPRKTVTVYLRGDQVVGIDRTNFPESTS